MKYFLILLLFLTSCATSNIKKTNSLNNENLFKMSIEDYKKMLNNYNQNNKYPNIDN